LAFSGASSANSIASFAASKAMVRESRAVRAACLVSADTESARAAAAPSDGGSVMGLFLISPSDPPRPARDVPVQTA
jgi:hypothetical protein